MASNKTPLKGYMDGIDISAWQVTTFLAQVLTMVLTLRPVHSDLV